jgi:hypothetical protein
MTSLVRLAPTGDTELEELEREFGDGQERIVGVLALAMAVQRDASLRASIAQRATDHRFALALETNGPFVVLEDGKLVGAAMPGERPAELEVVELRESVEASPATRAEFQRAYRASRSEADRAMLAMRDDAETFSRETFIKLLRWSPLVAADAYRQAALLQSMFDLGRARVLADPRPEPLHAYWMHAHLLGHLTMLAAAAEPTAWLAEMANAFPWHRWTPSFALVRERISRLAVRGAWASTRFGTSTVDRYLVNLDAPQLLRVFDAVLALVSIATAFDRDRDAISRELFGRLAHRERGATTAIERATLAALTRSARIALDTPDAAERALVHTTTDRLEAVARAVDSDSDAAELDDNGVFPSILAMATLAVAPAAVFFPRQPHDRALRWRPARALEALTRTLARHSASLSDQRIWN